MCVIEGGMANSITVSDGGYLTISSGGTATVILENGGHVDVRDGADVIFANFFSGSIQNRATVHSGTTANSVTINSEGKLYIYSGGMANSTMLNSYGFMYIYSGGTAMNTIVCEGGSMFVSSGGTATDTIIDYRGNIWASEGGTANNTTINSGGSLTISSGGTAMNIIVNNGGSAKFYQATVDSVTVNAGATLTLNSGTVTNILENGGCVGDYSHTAASCSYLPNMFSGLILDTTATVHSGTTATETTINAGYLMVFDGGVANRTTVNNINGGYYHGIDMFGGTANDTTVNSGGIINFGRGGTANYTTLNSGGSIYCASSCLINCIIVNSGGQMNVYGGTMTGKMTFESGARVYFGGTLDFNLDQAGETALVNDLSIIQGTPIYTLTVDDDLKPGNYVYSLADGAAEFASTISVVNKAGDELGAFTVGETVKVGYDSYTLNLNEGLLTVAVESPDLTPTAPVGTAEQVSWETNTAKEYVVEYSTDNFEHVIQLVTTGNAVDTTDLPAGTYQWHVKADANSEWAVGEAITVEPEPDAAPKVVQSNEDGNDDLFFATPNGTWSSIYYAQHVGSINDWTGTNDIISASGKGRIQNLFFGSSDPNVLCLTDGENGDAIFVDDVYTDLPEGIEEHTARLYKIQEVRAGIGDDIVDMTSQRFAYIGSGLTIRGGAGNDTIWANRGDNWLFGDAGNDRIVGASGNDVIAGGIRNDRMHGGGGEDIFTFCDNWGVDNVEQLETGTVTLWFASGSMENWNAETLTYTDGDNSVKVTGITSVTLKFGGVGEDAAMFATLSEAGAFKEFTSQKIFEESKGLLA